MDAPQSHTTVLTDANFTQEVRQFEGVVLVDFWAAWCGPCLAMGPAVEQIAQKYANNPMVKIATLDVDANMNTSNEESVMSLPTFKVFVNGQPASMAMGINPPAKLEQLIEQALAQKVPTA